LIVAIYFAFRALAIREPQKESDLEFEGKDSAQWVQSTIAICDRLSVLARRLQVTGSAFQGRATRPFSGGAFGTQTKSNPSSRPGMRSA
jgi:hypothetical protein